MLTEHWAAISFYKKVLQDEVFDRDEYKEMAELGLMILDQTQAYKIYRPCEPNSARFLNSGLNYQKLFLLMNQFPNLVSKDELPEVNAMAEFSSIIMVFCSCPPHYQVQPLPMIFVKFGK